MADVQKQEKEGLTGRIADFLCHPEHEQYVLLKHQELERKLGKKVSHAAFMRWLIENQPDYKDKISGESARDK